MAQDVKVQRKLKTYGMKAWKKKPLKSFSDVFFESSFDEVEEQEKAKPKGVGATAAPKGSERQIT